MEIKTKHNNGEEIIILYNDKYIKTEVRQIEIMVYEKTTSIRYHVVVGHKDNSTETPIFKWINESEVFKTREDIKKYIDVVMITLPKYNII